MSETIEFLLRHGYLVLFGFVLAEQLGLPLPAIPVLLAAGALVGAGKLSLPGVLAAVVFGSLLADLTWFELGRRRGHSILNWLCRISLEPDSCVRKTQESFARNGARTLLIAKFVPGLSTIAPPLAGMFRMRYPHFLLWDGGGIFLWAGGFGLLGYIFSAQIEYVAVQAERLGGWLLVLIVAALGGYIGWKYFDRQRFIRRLRIARISVDELRRRIESGEEVVVVDLRGQVEFEAEAGKIPGALHLHPDQLEERHAEIPRDREIILYCT
jgi:membrane protein DedA with SNARE-associated domain